MCNESVQQMTSLSVLVLVLGIGIVRYQSIGYWVLGVQLGIVLTLVIESYTVSVICYAQYLLTCHYVHSSCHVIILHHCALLLCHNLSVISHITLYILVLLLDHVNTAMNVDLRIMHKQECSSINGRQQAILCLFSYTHFDLFCSCELDLHLLTLTHKNCLDILKTCLHT